MNYLENLLLFLDGEELKKALHPHAIKACGSKSFQTQLFENKLIDLYLNVMVKRVSLPKQLKLAVELVISSA